MTSATTPEPPADPVLPGAAGLEVVFVGFGDGRLVGGFDVVRDGLAEALVVADGVGVLLGLSSGLAVTAGEVVSGCPVGSAAPVGTAPTVVEVRRACWSPDLAEAIPA
jgi:hypothetical protein